MSKRGLMLGGVAVAIVALTRVAFVGARHVSAIGSPPARMRGVAPPVMLWAWERPEDLRHLASKAAGVAFLAERVSIGRTAVVTPRRQRIDIADGVYAEAVVRMEAGAAFADSPELRAQTEEAITHAAALPGVRGVQIDFDAAESQQAFYAAVLRSVRAQLPPAMPLTITALAGWCADPAGWLAKLPVDAAVPMYFRLGEHQGRWIVRQPLCAGSMGISTDEPRSVPTGIATGVAGPRIYVFSPRPWSAEQIATVNRGQLAATFQEER